MAKLPPPARTAVLANGMVWFGLAFFFAALAAENTYSAWAGQWFNILGWILIVTAALALAVVGVIECRNMRIRSNRH